MTIISTQNFNKDILSYNLIRSWCQLMSLREGAFVINSHKKCHVSYIKSTNKCYATLTETHIIPIITRHIMSYTKWQSYVERYEWN